MSLFHQILFESKYKTRFYKITQNIKIRFLGIENLDILVTKKGFICMSQFKRLLRLYYTKISDYYLYSFTFELGSNIRFILKKLTLNIINLTFEENLSKYLSLINQFFVQIIIFEVLTFPMITNICIIILKVFIKTD